MEQLLPFVMMGFAFLLVAMLTSVVKAIVEARTRQKYFASPASDERLRMLLTHETLLRRRAGLRWGVVLCCLAGGFTLIETLGWRQVTPGAIAILLGATGIGNVACYLLERAAAGRDTHD